MFVLNVSFSSSIPNIMSEKFSLKWNDYQSNWNRSLSELRNQTDFSDVTLISDDKVKFSAHKILLSSCSNVFKFILRDNTNVSPLLYLGGVSSVNLGLILDYMYHGEVNLFQEQLDSFLESAQKLEIEGLLNTVNDDDINEEKIQDEVIPEQKYENYYYQQVEETQIVKTDRTVSNITRRQNLRSAQNDVTKFDVGSCTPEEIEKKTIDLYEKRDGVFSCLACEYTTSKLDCYKMKRHIEVHFKGLSYPCSVCNKEFRSKNSLVKHKNMIH